VINLDDIKLTAAAAPGDLHGVVHALHDISSATRKLDESVFRLQFGPSKADADSRVFDAHRSGK
jgi:hypothetical protein